MQPVKSGFLSSEFLTMLVTQVISLAVIAGWVKPADVSGITEAIITIISALVSLLTAVVYIRGRIEIKKINMQNMYHSEMAKLSQPQVTTTVTGN